MKSASILLVLAALLLSLVSCQSDEKKEDNGNILPDNKDTLSSWSVKPSGAWSIRLDLNSANLTGNSFTLVYKFADSGEIHCPTSIMAGSEGSGSYQTGTCTQGSASAMASLSMASALTSSVVGGTYTNTGSILKICKQSGTCLDYE